MRRMFDVFAVCKNKESVVMEILSWAEKGEEDVAFQYNIIKMVEDEKAEGRAEGELLIRIAQLRKKYRKGKTLSEAAEDLEEEEAGLRLIYDLIAQYPEEEDDRILGRIRSAGVNGIYYNHL